MNLYGKTIALFIVCIACALLAFLFIGKSLEQTNTFLSDEDVVAHGGHGGHHGHHHGHHHHGWGHGRNHRWNYGAWHHSYWNGGGAWGSRPGYYYDPNYYYNSSAAPSVQYEIPTQYIHQAKPRVQGNSPSGRPNINNNIQSGQSTSK